MAGTAAGAGTFAYFSDTESSTGNTVQAGTLDISDPADAVFSGGPGAPGEELFSYQTIIADYTGSVSPVEIDFDTSWTEADPTAEPDVDNGGDLDPLEFASRVELTNANIMVRDASNSALVQENLFNGNSNGAILKNQINCTGAHNSNGRADLADLLVGLQDYDRWAEIEPGWDIRLALRGKLPESVSNPAQADGIEFTITTIAEQPESD